MKHFVTTLRYTASTFLLSLLFALAAHGQNKVKISPAATATDVSLIPNTWIHGMVERRFTIDNSAPNPLMVTLQTVDTTLFPSAERLHSATVLAAGQSRTLTTLYCPMINNDVGNSFSANFKVGREVTKIPNLKIPSTVNRYSDVTPLNLLVSRGLSAEELKTALSSIPEPARKSRYSYNSINQLATYSYSNVVAGLSSATKMKSLQALRFEGEGSAWPRHWLAFSSFDGCLIAAADYELMPTESRQALHDYVAAGGHVTFFGMTSIPGDWTPMAGISRNYTFTNPLASSPSRVTQNTTSIGFGAVTLLPDTSTALTDKDELTGLIALWVSSLYHWLSSDSSAVGKNTDIPVAPGMGVPLQGFLLVLLFFVVLAGPGVLIFTRRTNRRILMITLVPAISLAFTIVVISFAVISEGITISQRRQSITLLDQPARRAVTYGAVGIYAPVALRDGLHFDIGTEVTPLSPVRTTSITSAAKQHYRSGWTQPRIPAFFRVRRCEPRSERLVVREISANSIEVANALGAAISHLRLCDSRGNLFEADSIAPGEKITLHQPQPRPDNAIGFPAVATPSFKNQVDSGWDINATIKLLSSESPSFAVAKHKKNLIAPEPGSYIAILEDAPFIENPLAYCRTKGSANSIVAGWY